MGVPQFNTAGAKSDGAPRRLKVSYFNVDAISPIWGAVIKHHASGRPRKPLFDFQMDGLPETQSDGVRIFLQRHLNEGITRLFLFDVVAKVADLVFVRSFQNGVQFRFGHGYVDAR